MNRIEYEQIGARSGNLKTVSAFQLFINDVNIDEEYSKITGLEVETIEVKGREMLVQDLETVVPKGLNGSQIISSQLKPRKLEIKLEVDAQDEQKLQEFYKLLMQDLLNLTNVKFKDEDLYYFGRYTDYKSEVIKTTHHFVTLEVLCNDVYKYTDEINSAYSPTSSGTIKPSIKTQLPIKPILSLELTNTTKSFFIYVQDTNDEANKHYVYFENETYFPRNIEIDFKDLAVTGDPTLSKTDLLHTIRIDSDVENFEVNNKDIVYFSESVRIARLKYRGVYL